MLELSRLRMLVEAGHRGSIAAAAKELHLTPSAVSQQLKVLAQEVRIDLLERVPGGVRLTAAGALLVEYAERALGELEQAEQALAVFKGTVAGTLRVGCFPSAAGALLPSLLAGLARTYPDLTVTLHSLNSRDAVGALTAGEVDAAFVASYEDELPTDRDLRTTVLGYDRLQAIAAPDHPLFQGERVELADLRDEPWLMDANSSVLCGVVTRACRRAGFAPRIRTHCPDASVTLAMAQAGLGVAVLPRMVVSGHGVAALPTAPALGRSVGLVVRRSRLRLPAVQVLLEESVRLCSPVLEST
ncbi:LysR family transcriptional regulator [Streptomyces decoyicus]